MTLLLLLLASAGVYVASVIIANRTAVQTSGPIEVKSTGASTLASRRITLLNWNLGFAGLGADAEFAPDGGASYLPGTVAGRASRNLDGIKQVLATASADIFTLQEVTRQSGLNANVPMWAEISGAVPAESKIFKLDLFTRLVPWPLRMEHGLGVLSAKRIGSAEAIPLPLETSYWLGFIRKMYALVVVRLPIGGEQRNWVVINLHLAAYDAKGETRLKQIATAVNFAKAEFTKGSAVILAGDWNMLLTASSWPHKTDPKNLEWADVFPRELLPPNWQLVFDPERPTVRQLDKPYRPGENFVAIIDGFIVSPNVLVEQVRTMDLGFANSDHQPVSATFALR